MKTKNIEKTSIGSVINRCKKIFLKKKENQISPELKAEIRELYKHSREYSKSLQAKFDLDIELSLDVSLGNKWDDSMSLDDNIRNLLGVIRYNTASGLYNLYRAYDYEMKYKKIKKDITNTFTELQERFYFDYL